MNEKLQDTIRERIKGLPDEAARQLLDYVEFLESKFNRSSRPPTTFERIADNVEGTLRGTRFGEVALRGGAEILEAAGGVIRGVAAAGRAVADELQQPAETPEQAGEPEPKPRRTSAEAEVEVDIAAPPRSDTGQPSQETRSQAGEHQSDPA